MKNDFNPWKVKSLTDFTCVVYRCPECERSFSTSEQFIGHAMMSHPKARDTLPNILNVQDIVPDIRFEEKSEITEKSLVNPDLVEVKQESKRSKLESVQKYQCHFCGKKVKKESKLEKVEIYQCNICGKSLRSKKGRSDHMKICQKGQNQGGKNLKKIKQKMKKLKKKQALLSK